MDYAQNIRNDPVKAKKGPSQKNLELALPFLPYFIEPVISYFCMILYIPLLENRQAVSFRIFVMLSIDFQKNHHKIPILSMLCTLFLGGLYIRIYYLQNASKNKVCE